MGNIDRILKFTEFLNAFRNIERRVLVHNKDRYENDVEHSYSLAMLGWYINESAQLGLDTNKILKYALAHDLVEVYAGDTWFYQTNQKVLDDKKENEHRALEKIKEHFREFNELGEIIEAYEARSDREGKFVYALDKLEPMLAVYLDNGRTWHKEKITLEQAKQMKIPKVKIDPEIEKYFYELLELLESRQKELFWE